jgi:hypothetical protein
MPFLPTKINETAFRIQLPPNATLTSSNLGIAIRPDQQYVYATMITQPSMIPQKFYGQPVNVSGSEF